ncbi:MAG: hypothetical protein M3209_20655 [Acidobacteriota bacterium]|nr:hypothetical protein [Acidobacteriota bacterium]
MHGQTLLEKAQPKSPAKCDLTIRDAPALLGMRLGMSLEETKRAAPNQEFSRRIRKANGVSTSLSSKPTEEAGGVVNSFLDDKLFEIDILYSSAKNWDNTTEFIREFSRIFNLPEDAWEKKASGNRYSINCQGFTIVAIDKNHIILSDANVGAESRKRTDEIAVVKNNN